MRDKYFGIDAGMLCNFGVAADISDGTMHCPEFMEECEEVQEILDSKLTEDELEKFNTAIQHLVGAVAIFQRDVANTMTEEEWSDTKEVYFNSIEELIDEPTDFEE